jgi:outer membrane immunogenic protein
MNLQGDAMSGRERNSRNLALLLLIGLVVWLLPVEAFASTDNDQFLTMLQKLEARVEALEAKNAEYRNEIVEARQQAKAATEKLRLVSSSASTARNSYASYSVKADHPLMDEAPVWSGAYWGASTGGAVTRSRVTSTEQAFQSFPTNASPFNIQGENSVGSSGPGNHGGAVIDVFAGWNFQVSPKFVVGGQLEATVSDLNFNSAGTKTDTSFDGTGPNGQTAIEDFRPQVSSNWMASALLRAGFLADDKTLIYGIGGLTLAQFQANNLSDTSFIGSQFDESFMAAGWTAGAGIERKLDSHWSIRGEYRYTNFDSHSSNGQISFVSNFPETQSLQRQVQFNQSMQVGRIGVAYALGIPR